MAEAAQPADLLARLIDIPLPPSVSLLPQTWPSRIAIVLAIVALIAGVWWFVRWWHANRYRRAALAELDAIERAIAHGGPHTPPPPAGGRWPSEARRVGVNARHGERPPPGAFGAHFPLSGGGGASGSFVDTLALLVRRTALAAFPREEIAALTGPTWLAFLDRHYGGREFSRGVGRALSLSPYEPQQSNADTRPLIDLVRRWIRTHHD